MLLTYGGWGRYNSFGQGFAVFLEIKGYSLDSLECPLLWRAMVNIASWTWK